MISTDNFVRASVWYGSANEAQLLLAENPAIADSNIYIAALLGNVTAIKRYLKEDPGLATAKGEALGWDALTYLCFSKFLRIYPPEAFIDAAKVLIETGADVNTGFFEDQHTPHGVWESALYGAAGVAFHPQLTQLLLEHGADPNDDEVPYHSPESYDNRSLQILLDSKQLTADSLAIILLRKCDLHDTDGISRALIAGADPNRMTMWGVTALHQAIQRDNQVKHVRLMMENGADPTLPMEKDGHSAILTAAHRGRKDILELFSAFGFDTKLQGVDEAARCCAMGEPVADSLPNDIGGLLLGTFAGNNNATGLASLLDLGIPVDQPYFSGDAYFAIPRNGTALQIAAWRGAHDAVTLLVERGADVNLKDANGRTPLMLAVRACIDSYWMAQRKPNSIAALLGAGALKEGITLPTGYDAADLLLMS